MFDDLTWNLLVKNNDILPTVSNHKMAPEF